MKNFGSRSSCAHWCAVGKVCARLLRARSQARAGADGTGLAARAGVARRALHPLDVTLRYGRTQQWLRRLALTFSCAVTVVLPLWHLRLNAVAGAPLGSWVGAPTSIRLWGIELVDPLESLSVALTRGVSAGWWLMVLPGVLLVLVLGRFFCGWVCPYLPLLAASTALRWLLGRLGFTLPDLQVPRVTSRVVMVGLLVATAWSGTVLVPLLYPPAIIGREWFRFITYGSVGAGVLGVVAAFTFDTFVSRAGFCRSLCPGGAMFSLLASTSPLRVTRDVSKCTDCTVCDVVCNLGQRPMTSRLDEGCERCGKCIASCPTKALSWKIAKPPLFRPPTERP